MFKLKRREREDTVRSHNYLKLIYQWNRERREQLEREKTISE